jgi:CRISPR-associated protein Csm1
MEGFDQRKYRTVVLAALLHDVGKLFEMGGLIDDYQKADTILQGDHPKDRKKLYCKQVHVLHTKDFCEVLAKQIPSLLSDPVAEIKKPGQDWINLSFRHHIASTPLEKMIQKANQLSTSEQEDFCDETVPKKKWLEPVIERISLLNNVKTEPQYAFEIRALTLEKDCLFPKLIKEIEPQICTHNDTNQIPIDNKNYLRDPKADYRRLGNEMLKEISHLPNNLSFYSLMETILALFEKYLSCVPALTNVRHPDISLYDHLRTTAAIADGLYRYESEKENLIEEPWLLICGDFSGIQKFIYRITSKGAAKSIRGRSLFVQLLCDAATDYILKRIDGLPTSKIYSSGGKFYLLVSSTCRQGVCDAVEFINDYLLSEFGGDVFLGLGIAPVTAKHFEQGEMSEQWKAANIDLMKNRKQRFAAQMKKQKGFFDLPSVFESTKGCQVCGRDDISVIEDKDNKRRICKMCKQLEELGGHLKDVKYFLWSFNVNISKALRLKLSRKSDLDLSKLGIQLFLLKDLDALNGFDSLSDCRIERINSTDFIHGLGAGSTFRFLGHWDPDKLSGDWEFDDFANNSVVINRLGILRMDVDNLGQVFIKGLQFPDMSKKNSPSVKKESDETIMRKPMASICRVATLSRQLNIFFSGYLIKLLRKYERCQIIYAGGDDLFIIGSWDELPEVAKTIRAAFQAFCCKNPDMTISGGIALTGGKYPISRGADHAGAAEELAKNCKHGNKEKDAFCFLDESLSWKDFITAGCLKDLFQSIVADKNKGFLNKMRNIVLVNKAFEREKRCKGMNMEEIQKLLFCDKWRWQIAYSLKRYVTQGEGIEGKVDAVRDALFKNVVNGSETDMPVIRWLGLPTRWTEFLERKEGN